MQSLSHAATGTAPASEAILDRVFAGTSGADLRAALVGRGILASKSPQMHVSEGARLGLSYAYRLIDFDELGLGADALAALVRAAAAHGLAGLNVTHPFKQDVLASLDGLSADAAAIGAVNTVVLREGRAVGHNTDCWGFAESFRREMAGVPLGLVLLVGAGGAGMAVARALFELGAERIAIFDLDRGRAASLAKSLSAQFGDGRATVADSLEAAGGEADGLVNTTPVGMAKYPGLPVPAGAMRRDLWVADVIYFPAETELLRAAAAAGSRIMSGRGMAIFQAVRAFELITGHEPDPEEMARHFEAMD